MEKDSTKSRIIPYTCLPRNLWRKLKKHLPKSSRPRGRGRPRVNDRDVINGIWYAAGVDWGPISMTNGRWMI